MSYKNKMCFGTSLHLILSVTLLTPAYADPDPCVRVDTTDVCSGDQSDGINVGDVSSLTVTGLTQDITPASGVIGIQ